MRLDRSLVVCRGLAAGVDVRETLDRRPAGGEAQYGLAGAMGLLDDAIREHLELKRRRGADPAEVAREQREALAAAPDREARPEPGDAAEEPLGEAPQPAAETLASVASGETGNLEETAELDMNAVLEHEPPPESARTGEDDSLEWEVAEQI